MNPFLVTENDNIKTFASADFNYIFNKQTGFHAQWGTSKDEDPIRCNYGPVIADIEVVSMCKGPGGNLCPFCYKGNTPNGDYLAFEDFKTIFHKLPTTLTQIAFGADADCSLNPDIFKMMEYCRSNPYQQIIPNITVADITPDTAAKLAALCGAVSVSWYGSHTSKDYCYNSIQYLADAGLKQINMHFMLSSETYPYIDELINDIKTDSRLSNLNAVVFLSLKQKKRGSKFTTCDTTQFKSVIDRMFEHNIKFGFDSCSAPKFLTSIIDHPKYSHFKQYAESCESFAQSIYINEKGIVYPCSFMENISWNIDSPHDSQGWNLLDPAIDSPDTFLSTVWNSPRALAFAVHAKSCADCGQGCQIYSI